MNFVSISCVNILIWSLQYIVMTFHIDNKHSYQIKLFSTPKLLNSFSVTYMILVMMFALIHGVLWHSFLTFPLFEDPLNIWVELKWFYLQMPSTIFPFIAQFRSLTYRKSIVIVSLRVTRPSQQIKQKLTDVSTSWPISISLIVCLTSFACFVDVDSAKNVANFDFHHAVANTAFR